MSFDIALRDNGAGTFDIALADTAPSTPFTPWVMIF
jgi:hypothetical protein